MVKKIALLLITGGLCFLIYGGWQLWHTGQLQDQALNEAKAAVSKAAPFDRQFTKQLQKPEASEPKVEDAIGILKLPSLNETLPIIEGTSDDALARGVGHYRSSALPGGNDQIVLSGHRDTVFQDLGELEKGDEVQILMPYGTFSYTVDHTEIVEADDQTVIRSTAPKEMLTLTTCYPFNYVGPAPKRYIVYALPTDGKRD